MRDFLEQLLVRGANRWLHARDPRPREGPGVLLGYAVSETGTSGPPVRLADTVRPEHVAILGKTGTGKTSLIRVMSRDDIRRDLGAVHIDLHGDTTPYLLSVLAAEERRRRTDLSDRIILIDPSDPDWAVGLNVLQADSEAERFIQMSEVAQLLKQRWDLATLGARTEELLRCALYVLSAADLTLLELAPLLTNATFRAACLRRASNPDIVSYFRERYDVASDAMQATWREPILNKASVFTVDPHFRHILGQRRTGVSLVEALDRQAWILLNLPKGRLGEQAATLGSLFLTHLKRALFARRSRTLLTVYADELQNLVEVTSGIDTLLAEARKFGVAFCCANQFLEQYPPTMRAAVLSVGTHVFFQLSAQDAERANALVGGGQSVQQLLRELPAREAILRRGGQRWQRFQVLTVDTPAGDPTDLVRRIRVHCGQSRISIESDIAARLQAQGLSRREDLHDWA
jgi:hypothetical protein